MKSPYSVNENNYSIQCSLTSERALIFGGFPPFARLSFQQDMYVRSSRQVSPFLQATQALTVSRGIALHFLGLRHQMGWGGSAPRSGRLYRRERPGTHCTGGWVGPRAGLDGRKISSHRDSIPDCPARSQSLYRLSYPPMKQWWNHNDRGKPKYSKKSLSQCHVVHHVSRMDLPGIETQSPRCQAGD